MHSKQALFEGTPFNNNYLSNKSRVDMDLGGFSRSSRLSVLGYSHDWPGWVYGLDLLIQLIKFVIREYMEPFSPGHTEFVQLGTNLNTYKRLVTADY